MGLRLDSRFSACHTMSLLHPQTQTLPPGTLWILSTGPESSILAFRPHPTLPGVQLRFFSFGLSWIPLFHLPCQAPAGLGPLPKLTGFLGLWPPHLL